MTINRYAAPVLAVLILLGTVGVAQATGRWIVSGRQMVDAENLQSGDDIRGWMTLQQVADGLAIDVETLYSLVAIPPEITPDTALKDLEGVLPEFEVTTVREAVEAHLHPDQAPAALAAEEVEAAAPSATPAPPTSTPQAAATPTPLPEAGAPSDSTPGAHEPTTERAGSGEGTGPTPLPEGQRLAAADIKGRHTLAEIADQAEVPLEDLLEALDLPPDADPAQSVRELVEAGVIAEVDAVRSAVTSLQKP